MQIKKYRKYNPEKGYSFDSDIIDKSLKKKLINTLNIVQNYIALKDIKNILVAGCGRGDEAKIFYEITSTNVNGIDLNAIPCQIVEINKKLTLEKGDILRMDFPDSEFDFIYCYHVLEHVNIPELVLNEFYRVLKRGGVIFMGFPNRNRILPSYFSSHLKIKIINVVLYNLYDYYNRIIGRFKNEYGAHAGFTKKEFLEFADKRFEINVINITWIKYNYNKYYNIFKIFERLGIAQYFYPSNYFILKK